MKTEGKRATAKHLAGCFEAVLTFECYNCAEKFTSDDGDTEAEFTKYLIDQEGFRLVHHNGEMFSCCKSCQDEINGGPRIVYPPGYFE